MGFNRYKLSIFLRLVLMAINCYGIAYVAERGSFYWTLANLILLLLFQIYLFFQFLTKWQSDVNVFANAVKHGDYNITYHLLQTDDPHFELYQMLNNVSRYVRELKASSEQQNQYFRYVVENAQIGLVAYKGDGTIVLINRIAQTLTGITDIKNLHQLKAADPAMHDQLLALGLNQAKLIMSDRDRSLKLSARRSKFKIGSEEISLLSLVNIRPELEENELQSWQELISVLTHEIMNSITPIHSLNGSMAKYLDRIEGNEDIISKAKNNLDVINRRSLALMSFVDRYRKITAVPLPQKQRVSLSRMINDTLLLMQEDLNNIRVEIDIPDDHLKIDVSQIGQVLINVMKNAILSMQKSTVKKITISSEKTPSQIRISVRDTGEGIPSEILDKIFIPFFSTRKEGSGIGLTLSRQIMQRHEGSIQVQNAEGGGSIVWLEFPNESMG
jgi:two-component system, NtrC family, nitrogen regulation sensor histidine kinase NtrY